jgi:hypothetical protein
MQSETYNGYKVWGHAIQQQDELLQPIRFGASGTVTLDGRFVEDSGLIAGFDREEEAERAGLDWARAYVDSLG